MVYSKILRNETTQTNVMTPLGLRKKISISFLCILCIWLLGFLWFLNQIPQSKAKSLSNQSALSSTAIIVLTGGKGRLEYGVQLLTEETKSDILFITGVGKNVTFSDFLQQIPEKLRNKTTGLGIFLGHEAKNTIGNAQEVKQWLKNTPSITRIILVTSNYHMPRSLLELSFALPSISIIPAPVIANNDNTLNFSEYHKYIASKLRHLFISVTNNK